MTGIAAAILTQHCFAAEPAFEFDGKGYFLRGDEAGIREYLTDGETFENWTTLMAVRLYPGIEDAKAYASKMLETVKASGPDARGLLMENKETGSFIVDFLLPSEKGAEPGYVEWNVWRIEKKNDGLEAVQYARRFYEFGEAEGREISAGRQNIISQLAEFTDPQ